MPPARSGTGKLLPIGFRRQLRMGAILGYLAFAAATSLVAWLAWSDRSNPENPALVLLITWVVAGITHNFVYNLWRACRIAAIASVLVYTGLAVLLNAVNEMLVAGMMVVGGLGFVLAMAMGIPVAMYRRPRAHPAGEHPAGDGRG